MTVTDASGKTVEVTKNADGTYTFTQPSGKVKIDVTFKEAGAETPCAKDDTCPLAAFTDLDPARWYHDGIEYCLKNGLMNGVGNNKFDPNGTTSRAMIVTILTVWRARNPRRASFSDVKEADTWYTKAVISWAESKIVEGYGDGEFGPNDHITREQGFGNDPLPLRAV